MQSVRSLIAFFLFIGPFFSVSGTPQPAPPATYTHPTVIDVWGGTGESIALMSDGTVWTWGWDEYGVLGNGHGILMSDPSKQYDRAYAFPVYGPGGIGRLTNIQAIAGGERHNAALDKNGEVWTWGWNAFGQLGNGVTCANTSSPECMGTLPAKIPNFTSVKAIASRGYHTLALKTNGTVWAWGYNDGGRLGDGTTTDQHSPVQINGLSSHGDVTQISGGGVVNAALMADHTLMAWGVNSEGAVGNGVFSDSQPAPVAVSQASGLTNVIAVATGWDHVVALAADKTVWTWGLNGSGQLGDGTTTNSSLPVHVPGLTNVKAVSAGDASTAVLKEDGTVWAWGINEGGELGDGKTYAYSKIPVQVVGLSNITTARAREWHNLAIKEDGTVWCWGSNGRGECGDGSSGNIRPSPVQVIFLTKSVFLPGLLP